MTAMRFWEQAGTAPCAGGFHLTLDGSVMRLPEHGPLVLPSASLAEAVRAEWQAAGGGKGGRYALSELTVTRLAATADRLRTEGRDEAVADLMRFASTDMLCYRATGPSSLVRRQDAAWQPHLDWAASAFGAELVVVRGVMPDTQPAPSLDALADHLAGRDAAALAALLAVVPALGSLILGLALVAGRVDAEAASRAALLEAAFAAELCGDEDQPELARRALARDLAAALRFLDASGEGG